MQRGAIMWMIRAEQSRAESKIIFDSTGFIFEHCSICANHRLQGKLMTILCGRKQLYRQATHTHTLGAARTSRGRALLAA